jgi:CubicO group peptidase (beta-lactamase class C family)
MSTHLKKSLIALSVLWLSFFLFSTSVEEKADATSKENLSVGAKIEKLFEKYNSMDSPGAAVAVVKDGMVVYRNGFGSAQLEYNIPISPSTVFHVASVSKQFTAMAVTMLEAEGKLSVDDDIRKYLPEVPDFGETISIRHLLHHTSGLRDQWQLLGMAGWRMDDVLTQKHIMDLVKRQKDLNFSPGERHMYCNTGYTLLAEIVSRVSGQPFEQWTKENIFKPLGMMNTHFHKNHRMIVKNRAYSYAKDDKNGLQRSVLNYANVGATSLFTTVEDMTNWMRNFDEKRVGGAEVIEKMLTKGVLNKGETISYARGIVIGDFQGVKTISHGGGDAGFRTFLLYVPEYKLGVVVLSNFASARPDQLCREIALIYRDSMLKQLPSPSKTAAISKKKSPKTFKIPAKKLAAFTGTYWLKSALLLRKIVLEKGKLYYVRSETNRTELIPVSKTEFRMKEFEGITVAFSDKTDGRYDTVIIAGANGPPLTGKWIKPFKVTKESLEEYVGRYYSQELQVYYELVLEKDKLGVNGRNITGKSLRKLPEDYFISSDGRGDSLKFQRDEQGTVIGFKVSTGRVLNLRFERVK